MTRPSRQPLPALLYHAVGVPPDGADPEACALFIHPDRFALQMKSLAERGFQTVSLREYAAALAGCAVGHRRLLITFDDAYSHLSELVTPILSRYNFTAVVFAPWQYLGDRNTWDANEHPELSTLKVATAVQLKEMSAGLWEVASHGKWHVDLRKVEPPERRAQLTEAREGLSQLLGQPVRELAYPYGDQDRGVRDDARAAGYRMAFVAGAGKANDVFQLPRRPISGTDGRLLFRLKTSAASGPLYSLRHLSRTATNRHPSVAGRRRGRN